MVWLGMIKTILMSIPLFIIPFFILRNFITPRDAMYVSFAISGLYLIWGIFRSINKMVINEKGKNVRVFADRSIICPYCRYEFEASFVGDQLAYSVICQNCQRRIETEDIKEQLDMKNKGGRV